MSVVGTIMANVVLSCVQILMESDSETETESSSEEERRLIQAKKKRIIRPRIIKYTHVVARYSNNEFKSHFRLVSSRIKYKHRI